MTNNFKLMVNPGTIDDYQGRPMQIFCTIKLTDGKLSISGIEGPKSNGDCRGGCGQIDMHLSAEGGLDTYKPNENWTLDKFRQFLDIWGEWHLNDMRAYDAEMKKAGWRELAKKMILKYSFTLTDEALHGSSDAKKAATDALKKGETFSPTEDQVKFANLPYQVDIYAYPDDEEPEAPEFYKRKTASYGDTVPLRPERKTLGLLRPSDHPDGLLGRALKEGGHTYGGKWQREEIPEEVIAFLQGLPRSIRSNPWGE